MRNEMRQKQNPTNWKTRENLRFVIFNNQTTIPLNINFNNNNNNTESKKKRKKRFVRIRNPSHKR